MISTTQNFAPKGIEEIYSTVYLKMSTKFELDKLEGNNVGINGPCYESTLVLWGLIIRNKKVFGSFQIIHPILFVGERFMPLMEIW